MSKGPVLRLLVVASLLGGLLVGMAPSAHAAYFCLGKRATKVGTAADNTIYGTARADVIVGLGGSDTIYGYGGNDTICGGDGDDNPSGDEGNDNMIGDKATTPLREVRAPT
ncbi:MAG: hypothetical protein H0W55_10480 [Actinobacteria bacterium]|nr:hypothetical protein [Actinomycetota bacterium]MDQ3530962.1 hypothetical protein [Actinomycetota bacterium]